MIQGGAFFRYLVGMVVLMIVSTTVSTAQSEQEPKREDWPARIDAWWGPFDLTVAQRISIFDTFWNTIDEQFACF
jgi:O-antigen ligase